MVNRVELRHRYPELPERIREVLTDPDYLSDKLRTESATVVNSAREVVSVVEVDPCRTGPVPDGSVPVRQIAV